MLIDKSSTNLVQSSPYTTTPWPIKDTRTDCNIGSSGTITFTTNYNITDDRLYKVLKNVLNDVSKDLRIEITHNLTDKTVALQISHCINGICKNIIHRATTKVFNNDIKSACGIILEDTMNDLLYLIIADLIGEKNENN